MIKNPIKEKPLLQKPKPHTKIIKDQHLKAEKQLFFYENLIKDSPLTTFMENEKKATTEDGSREKNRVEDECRESERAQQCDRMRE